jgi:hypothetical protein
MGEDVPAPRRRGATMGGDEFMACGGDDAGSCGWRLVPNSIKSSSSAGSDAGMVASEESSGNSGTDSGLGCVVGGMSHVMGVKASARGCGASLRPS